MKLFLLIILAVPIAVFSQSERYKWTKSELRYEMPLKSGKNYHIDNSSLGGLLLTTVQSGYYFFISDLDGDNCPFYPSCSVFFVKSVEETNIVSGLLMFADRFTRDTNLFKRKNHYQIHSSGKLFDPIYNYTLNEKKINLSADK